MTVIDRHTLTQLIKQEELLFEKTHPKSKQLFEKAKETLFQGVPMLWMVRSPGTFPIFVVEGKGQHFTDVDGIRYLDLALGDTGAMTGHAPEASTEIIVERIRKGITFMLPSEDAIWVGNELKRRFGLPYWQLALTATDCNRNVIRLARQITNRKKILVFNWCYHGTVDETFITLKEDGSTVARSGNMGPPVDPNETTRVIEFNDIDALERVLATREIAAVLAEPAMTNIGIVLPENNYHQKLRDLTRKYGTLLIIDETHTISAGIGGCTKEWGLEPDLFVLGKPIASGIPAAIWGFTQEVAERFQKSLSDSTCDTGGLGGTLAGNTLSLAAIRATLEHVLTEEAFKHTIALCEKYTADVEQIIAEYDLPWSITRLGCRAEYWFRKERPTNGAQAESGCDGDLDRYMHLAALNRNIMLTPFHNMALIAPQATLSDIEHHTRVFRECVEALVGSKKAKL